MTSSNVDVEARPAEAALTVLGVLGDLHVDLIDARYILGVAYLMVCLSTAYAQRLLAAVDECHATRGFDLHHRVRTRTT
jgi:hypothetical protein